MLQGVASYELHPCQTEHAFLITGEFLGKKSIPRKLITKLALFCSARWPATSSDSARITGKPEVIPQSASRKFNLTTSKIRRHCRRRVEVGTGEGLLESRLSSSSALANTDINSQIRTGGAL
jgi:hypothetical protein